MEQNNANNEDARQRVDVGVGVDVNLNDQPPAGGVEQAEPGIGMERDIEREEDRDRDAHVRNHMAVLLEAIQQNRVTLCPIARRHGVRRGVAQAAAGDDAAADAAEARVGAHYC